MCLLSFNSTQAHPPIRPEQSLNQAVMEWDRVAFTSRGKDNYYWACPGVSVHAWSVSKLFITSHCQHHGLGVSSWHTFQWTVPSVSYQRLEAGGRSAPAAHTVGPTTTTWQQYQREWRSRHQFVTSAEKRGRDQSMSSDLNFIRDRLYLTLLSVYSAFPLNCSWSEL